MANITFPEPLTPSVDWICAICQDEDWDYKNNLVATLYTNNNALCKHIFHLKCISVRPKEVTNCALCRQPVKEAVILLSPQKVVDAKNKPSVSNVAILATITAIGALTAGIYLWRTR